ncbi:hypothetical protein Tco_0674918 [Tanacetum coccineum]
MLTMIPVSPSSRVLERRDVRGGGKFAWKDLGKMMLDEILGIILRVIVGMFTIVENEDVTPVIALENALHHCAPSSPRVMILNIAAGVWFL